MFFPLYVSAATTQNKSAEIWYGPATATFPTQFSGNPYDPSENDVQVRFVGKGGKFEQRLAFFNAEIGSWQAVLVAHQSGSYHAQLIRNGIMVPGADKEGTIKLMAPLPHGFVRLDPRHSNRFAWDDGSHFTPIGFDLAWQNDAILPLTQQLAKMGKAGVNWTRIWACSWDGKNPWWPTDKIKLEGRELWPPAFKKWDQIVEACSASGVSMQWVLFHHGEFSSTVDANWQDNPWNAKNGGFLKKPGDFFTDPEAKRRAKIWLRYAVARYSASPAIFGWELFNEVQWVDPIHVDHRWEEVEAWHKEMADYLRSIDLYHHPVTSSSELRPNFDSSLDYVQPHTYPNNILASIVGTTMPKDKPGFYGEFGPANTTGADFSKVVLDGLLGGLLANHAGAGMFWYWETVEQQNLYSLFSLGRKVANIGHWDRHPNARIADLKIHTNAKSDFVFQPGLGWRQTTQAEFDLPDGATPSALGHVSSYLQGTGNRKLMPDPIKLKFILEAPSQMRIGIEKISDNGGSMEVKLDGVRLYKSDYKKGDRPQPVELPIPRGVHVVELSNDGPDWINLNQVTIGNLAPAARVEGLAESDWMMARITHNGAETNPLPIHLSSVPLSQGQYRVTEISLPAGDTRTFNTDVNNFELALESSPHDSVLIFEKVTKN